MEGEEVPFVTDPAFLEDRYRPADVPTALDERDVSLQFEIRPLFYTYQQPFAILPPWRKPEFFWHLLLVFAVYIVFILGLSLILMFISFGKLGVVFSDSPVFYWGLLSLTLVYTFVVHRYAVNKITVALDHHQLVQQAYLVAGFAVFVAVDFWLLSSFRTIVFPSLLAILSFSTLFCIIGYWRPRMILNLWMGRRVLMVLILAVLGASGMLALFTEKGKLVYVGAAALGVGLAYWMHLTLKSILPVSCSTLEFLTHFVFDGAWMLIFVSAVFAAYSSLIRRLNR